MLDYLWLIPLCPLLGFVINGLFGVWIRRRTGQFPPKRIVAAIACGTILLAFLVSLGCFLDLLQEDPEHRVYETNLFTWIPGGAIRTASGESAVLLVEWGLQLDPLSALMIDRKSVV